VTKQTDQHSRYLEEVEPAYRPHQARLEASRCLFCHDAPCARACPAGIDVSGFIRRLKSGNIAGAAQLIYEANILGGSCGRVCPVEILCQEACSHTELSEPIKIGRLQAYAWQHGYDLLDVHLPGGTSLGKVAVVGAGPSGLAAAAELARLGYEVKIFESGDRAGGVLNSGIPAYRLPDAVLSGEIGLIRRLGVEFVWEREAGRNLSPAELRSAGFEAVFLGPGLGRSARVGLPGEDLEGVFWAADLLDRIKNRPHERGELIGQLGRRVVIIGGGNVAIDVACSLLRLGMEKVSLVCLEGPGEMPAFPSEVRFALDEGVELHTRCRPLQIVGDEAHRVIGLEGIGIEWKKPNCYLPENAISLAGTEFRLQADSVVEAIGRRPERAVLEALQLEASTGGLIDVDQETGQTSQPWVFAAGDAVNGGATVVEAVAGGKKAAGSIHHYLQEGK